MTALGDLVRARLQERGWSYAEAARRAELPRSTVHFLATTSELRRMPESSTLEALARGLDLPLPTVREAAATAAGISVYRERGDDPEVNILIASLERLDPDDRRQVIALVDSLLRAADSDGPGR